LTRERASCRRKFLRFFPEGFRDPTCLDRERNYKWEMQAERPRDADAFRHQPYDGTRACAVPDPTRPMVLSATSLRRIVRSVIIASAIAATFVILVAGTWRLHRSRSVQLFGELVTFVATSDSVVALTFDDGPSAPYSDSILDLLHAERVAATFFVIGSAVERHPALARRMVEEGHELGNHSYSHRRMVPASLGTVRHEVETTDSLIRAAGAAGRIHFRPPYGKRLVVLPWYLARTDRTTALWTLEPDSWFRDRDAMARHVLDNVRPGAIILLHVELPSRAEERAALSAIIAGLRQQGYGFVTLSELMARGRD
jgi:peptidoglycan-N-acetylglucosamine deacetylase